MTKKKKTWWNSILMVNLKHWRCFYCADDIKNNTNFGIIRINGEAEAEIFCSEKCLKVYTLKMDAKAANK